MTDTFYKNIPINKAILLIHNGNLKKGQKKDRSNISGAIGINKNSVNNGIDYISRTHDYKNKGDIDRSITKNDLSLMKQYQKLDELGMALEYISRQGTFAEKGKEHQVDASMWNQYGPVDFDETKREMLDTLKFNKNAAYMDSVLSVKREYAQQIGLSTKEDFQKLLRMTWTDNVEQWDMIEKREDIRWVACYHSDAAKGLHVHVFTWSAKGEISKGDTIGAEATRKGKEIIFNEAYKNIVIERNQKQTYLRDLANQELKVQLDLKVDPKKVELLENRRKLLGYAEKLSSKTDIDKEGKKKITALENKLKKELESGKGLVAKNFKAQATARDIISTVEKRSQNFKNIKDEYKKQSEIKATIKGYSKDKNPKDFKNFVKSDNEDLNKRLSSQITKEFVKKEHQPLELRKDLQEIDCRKKQNFDNISFSSKLIKGNKENLVEYNKLQQTVNVRIPMYSNGKAKFVELEKTDVRTINNNKSLLAQIDLNKEYKVVTNDNNYSSIKGDEVVKLFGSADMERIEKFNHELTEENRQKLEERKLMSQKNKEQEEKTIEQAQRLMRDSQDMRVSDFSIKYGMSLDAVNKMQYNQAELLRSMSENQNVDSSLSYQDKNYINNISNAIVSSESVKSKVDVLSKELSSQLKIPEKEVNVQIKKTVASELGNRIAEHSSTMSQEYKPRFNNYNPQKITQEIGKEMTQKSQSIQGFGLTDMTNSLIESLGSSSIGASGKRMSYKKNNSQELEEQKLQIKQ